MQVPLFDINGSEKGKIELDDRVFNIKPNKSCIYYVLRAELMNLRTGTASTKTRSEVRGGGAKPWRQKGTGRARAGTRRSPIWVGGGIVFGPKPRSCKVKVPRKMRRLSLKSVLSLKAQNQQLKVVEDFKVESGKTRDFLGIASNLIEEEARKRVIFINADNDELTKRAGRNIPWLKIFNANLLNTKDLFYADKLLLTESAVRLLNEKYSNE